MSDTLSTTIVASLFQEVLKHLLERGFEAGGWAAHYIRNRGLTTKAATAYTNKLLRLYDHNRIYGMSRPIPLTDIFVSQSFSKKIMGRENRPATLIEQGLYNLNTPKQAESGIDLVNSEPRLAILGQPGAGKTTFLKYVLLQLLTGKLQRRGIPVYVALRDITTHQDGTLLSLISGQFDTCNFPNPREFAEACLNSGRCLILLDGLDEIPAEHQKGAISRIDKFISKYDKNQYILTCRESFYHSWFNSFIDVELLGFSIDQINLFIDKWFQDDPRRTRACKNRLAENVAAQDMASNPLLLTLMCISFEQSGGFPLNKAGIYQEALSALFTKWDGSRAVDRKGGNRHYDLGTASKERILSRVAAATFKQNRIVWSREDLSFVISESGHDLPEFSTATQIDGTKILDEIEEYHGIIRKWTSGLFAFSHLSFLEYYMAKYIADNRSSGEMTRLIEHLGDPAWHEVIVLTAALLPEGTANYLTSIREAADRRLEQMVQSDLLRRLEDSQQWTTPYTPVESRRHDIAAALSRAYWEANALDRELARVSRSSNNPVPSATTAQEILRKIGDLFGCEIQSEDSDFLGGLAQRGIGGLTRSEALVRFYFAANRHQELDLATASEHIGTIQSSESRQRWPESLSLENGLLAYFRACRLVAESIGSGCFISPELRSVLLRDLPSRSLLITTKSDSR